MDMCGKGDFFIRKIVLGAINHLLLGTRHESIELTPELHKNEYLENSFFYAMN